MMVVVEPQIPQRTLRNRGEYLVKRYPIQESAEKKVSSPQRHGEHRENLKV